MTIDQIIEALDSLYEMAGDIDPDTPQGARTAREIDRLERMLDSMEEVS